MKRIYLGLLFAGAVIAAASLAGATESGDGTPVIQTLLGALITTLILWKIADFWHRHRGGQTEGPIDRSDQKV